MAKRFDWNISNPRFLRDNLMTGKLAFIEANDHVEVPVLLTLGTVEEA
jgi:hypothetical protein